MKKFLAIVLAAVMLLSLVACGEDKTAKPDSGDTAVSKDNESGGEDKSDEVSSSNESADSAAAEETPAPQEESAGIKPAKDGEITLSSADIAVVVNGKAVPMPYNLVELENAGVPVNELFREDELTPGTSFGINLYLDENDDYVLIPDYYNAGDETVILTNAEAKTITMVSYATEPVDQGVSLLGVTFGMTKGDVKAMLGEPMSDDGSYCAWQIAVTDADYVGNLSIYFTGETDDSGASEIRLDFMEW